MAELLAVSQTSLLLFPQLCPQPSSRCRQSVVCSQASFLATSPIHFLTTRPLFSQRICSQQNQFSSWGIKAGVTSDLKVPTTFMANSAGERNDILPDSGGDGDNFGAAGGNGGGGGDNGGNSNNNEGKGGSDESEDHNRGNSKNRAISMSQKLTLGYAVLVGVGGVAGYLKSGSQKSLIAGGLSASLLYYVYTQLPTRAVFASSIGLGCSAALLGVMGSRFKKSGKIFPAGIVSFMSLIMTGGYLHGIMRGMH